MKLLIRVLLPFTFVVLSSLVFAQPGADTQRLQSILSDPPDGINSDVWRGAVISYLSQCAGGGQDCKCALVIAQGIQGDVSSTTMWIGTFKGGSPIRLWTGYGSRLAVSHQNTTSVNMPTDRCKRRNGIATVSGDQACIPGRRCRHVSVYRDLADELGLPADVALTSFYFSTPMHNEMYKFHDFYGCSQPPCPGTLGCLGLERQAMRALCLNHMGSNGSNGIDAPERGGAWLYFHNNSTPPSRGSEMTAAEGLAKFEQGMVCGDTSTAHLSSGELIAPDARYGDGAGGGNSEEYYSNNGMNPVSSGMEVMNQMGAAGYSPNGVPSSGDAYGDPAKSEQDEELTRQVIDSCQGTVQNSCPEVEGAVVREYCANPRAFRRGSCEFERVDEEER